MDELLDLFDPARLFREIGWKHDEARETYRASDIRVRDQAHFVDGISGYVRHHLRRAEGREISREAAFARAAEILKKEFQPGLFSEGYTAALMAGLGSGRGNMPDVLNALARSLRERAITDHVERVFHERIDPLSPADRRLFVEAFEARYGRAIRSHHIGWDEAARQASASGAMHLARRAIARLLAERNRFGEG